MPSYDFRCPACDVTFEVSRSMSQAHLPQSCPECGQPAARVFSVPGMVFAGEGWATKDGRVAQQMKDKNRRLDQKQETLKRDGPKVTLAPNVDGERVDSWADARKLAASKGKDTASYDALVRKETGK